MSNTNKKEIIKIGNGKKRKENWITASICIDKLQPHIYEYNGKQYVNININIKEQPDQYGKDVELSINDYKPNNVQINTHTTNKIQISKPDYNHIQSKFDDEVPF